MTKGNRVSEMFVGAIALLMGHLGCGTALFLLGFIAKNIGFDPLERVLGGFVFSIGLSQLVYAIPLFVYFKQQGRISALQGAMLGAILTVFFGFRFFLFLLWRLVGSPV